MRANKSYVWTKVYQTSLNLFLSKHFNEHVHMILPKYLTLVKMYKTVSTIPWQIVNETLKCWYGSVRKA